MTNFKDAQANVRKMSTAEVVALFKTLPAPEMSEMAGEYVGELLRHPNRLADILSKYSLAHSPVDGRWLCKAFRPVDAEYGRGYNTFERFGQVRQAYAMMTLLAPSRYDGNPAYQLVYRAYRSLFGSIHMVDEVRRLGEGVYLGIGTWGFTKGQRQIAYPFLLTGPIAPYRRDLDTKGRAVVLAEEIPALAL